MFAKLIYIAVITAGFVIMYSAFAGVTWPHILETLAHIAG